MPLTIQFQEGDGVADDFLQVFLGIPEGVAGAIAIGGLVRVVGQASVAITGGPLTTPAIPASGSTWYNIQVDGATGVASIQNSASAPPALNNATSRIVFSQTLTPGETSNILGGDDSTPDPPLNMP